jgi:predicted RNA methylase
MTDQFFTPPSVAKRLVSFFRTSEIDTIADFAAGDGELLKAAAHRWPDAECFATDIDPNCVSRLKKSFPKWMVGKCDFLNNRSRSTSGVLAQINQGISLILLNPPFSCKGSAYITVKVNSSYIRCSTAMAFVLWSLPYLADKGKLVAILPNSSIKSRKDAEAWEYIRSMYDVRDVASFGKQTFHQCSANTVIVRLQRKRRSSRCGTGALRNKLIVNLNIEVQVIRGCVPMHAARNGWAGTEYDLVHTTDMNRRNITNVKHGLRIRKRCTKGPSVLIPRVGQPSDAKCVLYLGRKELVLSDCVYAIRCNTSADARLLQQTLIDNWEYVTSFYSGTCAPYINIDGLLKLLVGFGANVDSVKSVRNGS